MKPELLSPAGSLEKLKTAVLYGADAVYCSGQKFGLRTAADNFTHKEMKLGVEFAHLRGSKVFVTLNAYLHQADFDGLKEWLKFLESLHVDALIVSDLGVVQFAKLHSHIPIHLSTQASCLNSQSAKFWRDQGVDRLVLGREVGLENAARIKEASGLEIELFIHGSMCMAYSGHCVISNYTQGRDSNRGGCAHSCRFEYQMSSEKKTLDHRTYMSSKDLNGLELLPKFFDYGIDSLKVEGRMKGPHYAGTVSKVYREAIDTLADKGRDEFYAQLSRWEESFQHLANRQYTKASLENAADESSIYDGREHEEESWRVAATLKEVKAGEYAIAQVRNPFDLKDGLEVMTFEGDNINLNIDQLTTPSGIQVDRPRPGMLIRLPYREGMRSHQILRGRDIR